MSNLSNKRLSFDALKEKAGNMVTTDDLMSKISGGTENDCHDGPVLIGCFVNGGAR